MGRFAIIEDTGTGILAKQSNFSIGETQGGMGLIRRSF